MRGPYRALRRAMCFDRFPAWHDARRLASKADAPLAVARNRAVRVSAEVAGRCVGVLLHARSGRHTKAEGRSRTKHGAARKVAGGLFMVAGR